MQPRGELVIKKYLHLGFAADTPGGLVVPVVRDADRKDVYELARELAALSEKARAGKLAAAEMQGGCFTVSSLGGIGGTAFTPIINAPEVAILGVSRSVQRPVYEDGALRAAPDAAAVAVVRPSRDRWRRRRAVHDGARQAARRSARVAGGDSVSRDGTVDVKVPDLGDFKDVAVIDVLVKAGDTVAVDTPLITLETEKAAMDVPSPAAGVVAEVTVRTGDRVNTGSVIARLRSAEQATRGRARLVPQGRDRAAPAPCANRSPSAASRTWTPCRSRRWTTRRRRRRTSAARRGGAGITTHRRRSPRRLPAVASGVVRLRSRRPGRRARRLYGGVSRRRSRSQGRAWSSAGRSSAVCVSTSVASRRRRCCMRRASSKKRMRWPRTASASARPTIDVGAVARVEEPRRQSAGRRPRRACPAAQGHGDPGHRPVHRSARAARYRTGRCANGELRAMHHRGGLRARPPARAARRSADHRFDRRARARSARHACW